MKTVLIGLVTALAVSLLSTTAISQPFPLGPPGGFPPAPPTVVISGGGIVQNNNSGFGQRSQPKEEGKMTRQVEINGREVKLYRVSGYENAWCSDPELATRIGRRRQALLRELKSTAQDIVALTEQNFDEEEYIEDNAA